MERFAGTVEYLCDVEVGSIVEWITAIDFDDWPQQHRLEDGGIRPAMVKDLSWHGFGVAITPLMAQVTGTEFSAALTANIMLTVVMPGHNIPTHTDEQPPHWLCRVHAPLTTTNESRFIVGGEAHHMEVGKAYLVNTEVGHSVENAGSTPRIHLMWDVWAQR